MNSKARQDRVQITLTDPVKKKLDTLVKLGMHGRTRSDVAKRLVEAQLLYLQSEGPER